MAAMYCEAINQVPSLECPFWPSTSTQLKSLSSSFPFCKLPEDFDLSSGGKGHNPEVA
jgi:hypothetical protein